jgi:hypothetical protein
MRSRREQEEQEAKQHSLSVTIIAYMWIIAENKADETGSIQYLIDMNGASMQYALGNWETGELGKGPFSSPLSPLSDQFV